MWNADQRLHVGPAAHPRRLDHAAAGPPGRLGAVRRSLVAVELEHGQADAVGGRGDVIERRVDEHARDLGPALDAPR